MAEMARGRSTVGTLSCPRLPWRKVTPKPLLRSREAPLMTVFNGRLRPGSDRNFHPRVEIPVLSGVNEPERSSMDGNCRRERRIACTPERLR